MSTKQRYGTAVWEAINRICDNVVGYHSIGEVAKEAGVTKPTAKKYLEILVENGDIEVIDTSARRFCKGSRFYRVPRWHNVTYHNINEGGA
jgi:predicted ArsR family transcriptional regulator